MSEMNQDKEAILRRLKKLLAMATDGRGNEAEAANAMRMAQKMMAAHGITEGALISEEVGEFEYGSTKAKTPPPWEGQLLSQLCRAFGARCYWSPGVGPKGARSKGHWVVIGHKPQLEMIRYAFDVVRRQPISARAAHVATLPEYWTRPRKATAGDEFGLGFVEALKSKITTYADQDERIKAEVDKRITDRTGGRVIRHAQSSYAGMNGDARGAGAAAGASASLHRATTGRAETLKIGG